MEAERSLAGLNCPKCGGMFTIPEGDVIVNCPFCAQRSVVTGDRGLLRTQVSVRVTQSDAEENLRRFLGSSPAIDKFARNRAKLQECFLVYMPFWQVTARVMAWVFGETRIKVNNQDVYHPIEHHSVSQRLWNLVAADVGALGVQSLSLQNVQQQPFDYEDLHRQAMVFEPFGSATEAQQLARKEFEKAVTQESGAERCNQVLMRYSREHIGLVYYPLWVLRYSYKGRVHPLVVDGFHNTVLYGKAPGDTLNRAFSLVSSSAAGAFLMVDIPLLLLWFGIRIFDGDDDVFEWILGGAAASFYAGQALVRRGYKKFRYGEHYQYPKDAEEK